MELYKCDPEKNTGCKGRFGEYCRAPGFCFLTSERECAVTDENGTAVKIGDIVDGLKWVPVEDADLLASGGG